MTEDDIRAAVKRLIDAQPRGSYRRFSQHMGRNDAYLQQYVSRGTPKTLPERDRRILAALLNVDEAELGGPPPAAPAPDPRAKWIRVPRFAVRAAGGDGAIAQVDHPIEHVPFDPAWLRGLGIRNLAKLSLIRVEGDSMLPTLGDGDDILVDRSPEAKGPRDGVFVLRMDGALIVKRLAFNPGKRTCTIRSDNDAYYDFPDCPVDELDVVGRVVWAAKAIS